MSLGAGDTIEGRYRLEERVGRGGYGEVYRATQLSLDRRVAVKLVHDRLADRDDVEARFRREAKLTSRLDHRNAIRVLDFGRADGSLYLVMEFVEGPTLAQRLARDGVLDPEEVRTLGIAVARALEAAHAIDLIHRDLKPSNILLGEDLDGPRPVVIDFGLIKALGEDDGALTRSDVMLGTPAYMSPELVRGLPLDGRADLYSLGLLLHEALTGSRPFERTTALASATARLDSVPPPLPSHVPDDLRELIAGMVSIDADARPQTAREIAERLESHAGWPNDGEAPTVLLERGVDATVAATRGPAAHRTPAPASARTGPRVPEGHSAPGFSWRAFLVALAAITSLAAGAVMVVRPITEDVEPAAAETAGESAASDQAHAPVEAPTLSAAAGALEPAPSPSEPTRAAPSPTSPSPVEPTLGAPDGDGAQPEPRTDAPPSPAPSVPVPTPALAATAPTPEAEPEPAQERRRETGHITVNVEPFGDVWIDGERIGPAPVRRIELAAGRYQVETRYAGNVQQERVRVSADDHTVVTHRYRR